jgi:hypothetical protein
MCYSGNYIKGGTMSTISIGMLPYMNEQEVFDHVSRHLLSQGRKSVTVEPDGVQGAAYHGQYGDMSAIGCLMDEMDANRLEGRGWAGLVQLGYVPDANYDLLMELEWIHDNAPVWSWAERLWRIAESRGLEFNPSVRVVL